MCSGLEEALGCTLPSDMDSEEARLALIELVGVAYCMQLTCSCVCANVRMCGCVCVCGGGRVHPAFRHG